MKKPKAAQPSATTKTSPSVPFSIRLSAEARAALVKEAEKQERPAAWLAQKIVTTWLRERGLLK